MSEGKQTIVQIEATNLSVYYQQTCALSIDHLQLSGNVIAVIGANGSGKSTFIKTILQLLVAKEGTLTVSSSEDNKILLPEDDMAYAPENGAVFNDVTVENYLKLWCRIKHGAANYFKKEGAYLSEQLEIFPLLKKLGRELSKGQRRRVQIAAGLLTDPRFFLFDEPFDGLDVLQSTQLTTIIEHERTKRSMLISTHRMDIVEKICDKIIVLAAGKISAAGDIAEVCQQLSPENNSLSLFDAMNYHLQQTNGKRLAD